VAYAFDERGPAWAPGYRHLSRAFAPVACGFREVPEDFEVDELPLFEPADAGEHLLVHVEKRGLSTEQAVCALAAALARPPRAFGYAGRKDAQAIARQYVSVEGAAPEDVAGLALRGLIVLGARRHPHKLRAGQLAGNRFRLRLRGVDAEGEARTRAVLDLLVERGLPNYYGAQRFGRGAHTHELGRLLLARDDEGYVRALVAERNSGPGDAEAELRAAVEAGTRGAQRRLARLAPQLEPTLAALARQFARRPRDWGGAVRAVPKATRRFQLNALQSRLFNRVLAARMGWDGGLTRVVRGDAAHVHASGAAFLVEDVDAEQPRAATFEISASGPMLGHRMLAPLGAPAELEAAAAEVEGVSAAAFRGLPGGLDQRGARRPLRAPVGEPSVARDGADLLLGFRLPPGAYATTLVEELRKEHARAE
jgi:tRNA pseudouridine13 synthase